MKILAVADVECQALWDYYVPGRLKDYDLIISCGDLHSSYLSFLVTMARAPLLYVYGNHDEHYQHKPPEGCDCIDDYLIEYNGIRILGLGGCRQYHPGPYQFTEEEMRKRIRRMRLPIWLAGGVDIVVTHAPPKGYGDAEDLPHWGFDCLVELLDKYHPQYLLHGHVHSNYDVNAARTHQYGQTQIINTFERYVLELPDRPVDPKKLNRIIWYGRHKD